MSNPIHIPLMDTEHGESFYRQQSETLTEFRFKNNLPCYIKFEFIKIENTFENRLTICNGYRASLPCFIPAMRVLDPNMYINYPDNFITDNPLSLKNYLENNIINHPYKDFGPYIVISTDLLPYRNITILLHLYRYNRIADIMKHMDLYWKSLSVVETITNIIFEHKGEYNNEFRFNSFSDNNRQRI